MFTLFPNAGCFFTNELNLQNIKVNIFTIQWISPIIEQASTAWIHFLRGGGLSRPLGVLVNFFTQCQFCYFQLYLVLTPLKKRNIPPFAGVVWEALAQPPQNKEFSTFSRGTRVSSSRQLLNVSSFQAHSWLYQAVLFSSGVLRTSENICYLFSWLCDLKYMQNWSPFSEESQLMDNSGKLSTTFIKFSTHSLRDNERGVFPSLLMATKV